MWNGSVWAGQVGLCKDQTTLKCPECKWTSCEFHIFTLHQLHFWLVHSRIHSNATEQKPENVIIRPYPFLSFSLIILGVVSKITRNRKLCVAEKLKGIEVRICDAAKVLLLAYITYIFTLGKMRGGVSIHMDVCHLWRRLIKPVKNSYILRHRRISHLERK